MDTPPQHRRSFSTLGILAVLFGLLWFFANAIGQNSIGGIPGLEHNGLCYPYLGCNAGFFGYDAFVHVLVGIFYAVVLVWASKTFPRFSLFHDKTWKNVLTAVACVALLAVLWELLEFSRDHFMILVQHIDLVHSNLLAQPSNADTMGDIFFTLLGSVSALSALKLWDKSFF